MTVVKFIALAVSTALSVGLLSCSGKNQKADPIMNEQDNSFLIGSEKIEYVIPTDISQWAVAPGEAMPEGMQFFGVDRQNGICVGLFKPDKPARSPHATLDFSDSEFRTLLKNVTRPDSSLITAFETIDYSDTIFLGASAKRFFVFKGVVDPRNPGDTVSVFYNGFVFDKINEPYGIVVISGESPFDGKGENNTGEYLNALRVL